MSESLDPQGRPVSKKQAASKGMDDGWTVTGTLITGIAFWGFVGWGLTKWTGWVGFFPIGVILGAVAGVYLVYKQASAPPPLLDISRKQDGGLAARHARRLAKQKADREAAEKAAAADESVDDAAAPEPNGSAAPEPDGSAEPGYAPESGRSGAGERPADSAEDEGHTDSAKE